VKIVVIGAGRYVTGRGTTELGTILPALIEATRSEPIESITICGRKPDGASEIATAAHAINSKLGTSVTVSYALVDEVLASGSADAAIVSIPDHLHFDIGKRVLERGWHCLMVKPLTPTLGEARELVAFAAARQLHAVVDFHKRYDEQNLVVKRLLGERALGRLAYATVMFSQRAEVPAIAFREWSAQTNIFQYLGVHYADLLYFMAGLQPIRAMAVGTKGVLASRGIDTYDSVLATVTWRDPTDGAELASQLAIGWIDAESSTAASEQKYTLVGERGRVECEQKDRGLTVITGEGVRTINPYFSQFLATQDGMRFRGYGFESVRQFIADVRAIREGRESAGSLGGMRPTFADALPATAIAEAVTKSLAQGGSWQDVDQAR
jgi:D-galacturonate reductase